METKELKINIPEGYEIDKDNSTFECIKFKPIAITYEDVAKELFADKCFCTGLYGGISLTNDGPTYPNRASSMKQLEKLFAINKLMNVAKYLNGNWQPNWRDDNEKFYPYINGINYDIRIGSLCIYNKAFVYFKSRTLVDQAVNILGEDTIKLALSTDW